MSREVDDWAKYEGEIQVKKPGPPSPATRLVKTKPSKKSSKPTPKYTVREDGTVVPYKAAVINTLTQLDRDDRLVRNPHTRADVPALKLRLTSSGFLIKIPPLKKEKEIIEIMSSDAESDDMPSSAGGVVHYDSDATVPGISFSGSNRRSSRVSEERSWISSTISTTISSGSVKIISF